MNIEHEIVIDEYDLEEVTFVRETTNIAYDGSIESIFTNNNPHKIWNILYITVDKQYSDELLNSYILLNSKNSSDYYQLLDKYSFALSIGLNKYMIDENTVRYPFVFSAASTTEIKVYHDGKYGHDCVEDICVGFSVNAYNKMRE